jgi:hypothetical protein
VTAPCGAGGAVQEGDGEGLRSSGGGRARRGGPAPFGARVYDGAFELPPHLL